MRSRYVCFCSSIGAGNSTTLANLKNSFNGSQFNLGHLKTSKFDIKTPNPQKVLIKLNNLTFLIQIVVREQIII